MIRIRGVETLGGFRVRLSLTDGSIRELDLGPYLNGPVFEPVRTDAALFQAVRVDEQLGTIVWPNGADIDPDVLILGRTPASFETQQRVSRGLKLRGIRRAQPDGVGRRTARQTGRAGILVRDSGLLTAAHPCQPEQSAANQQQRARLGHGCRCHHFHRVLHRCAGAGGPPDRTLEEGDPGRMGQRGVESVQPEGVGCRDGDREQYAAQSESHVGKQTVDDVPRRLPK